MKISGKPTKIPSSLQDEYCRSAISRDSDMDNDFLDFSSEVAGSEEEIPFMDVSGMVVPGRRYVSGDGSGKPPEEGYGEGDVGVGHGGVTYNRFGNGGVLPGYPTQEGMAKLILDRMMDDETRLAQGKLSIFSF